MSSIIIEDCREQGYSVSEHHTLAGVDVHVLTGGGWYVKFFFWEDMGPGAIFISVHRTRGAK